MTAPHRIVVVGNGMVASRFVDELARALAATGDPTDGSERPSVSVTVLGEEPYPAYNRLLLSDVLAERADLNSLTLPTPRRTDRMELTTLTGVRATRLDRGTRWVDDSEGARHRYDTLVFATGAAARIPDTLRRDGRAPGGVRVLRDLDDVRAICSSTREGKPAIVIGGGVLGIEVASGLRHRGAEVVLVHQGARVMERQLDPGGSSAAADGMSDLGIEVLTGVSVREVKQGRDGRVESLELDDGRVLPSELVVVTAGTVPRVELAGRAGLPIGGGITVGDDLRSPADPAIAAIGDCAEPPEGGTGLLAPGWEQATRLAARIAQDLDLQGESGDAPVPAAPRTNGAQVVRLKARGLHAVALGERAVLLDPPSGVRVLGLADPSARRSIRIAVAAERIVAAVCVGAPSVGAALTQAFEQGAPTPPDPAQLLLPLDGPRAAPSGGSPTMLPGSATLCRCNGVTKNQVVEAWKKGATTMPVLAERTRATTGCGGCRSAVCGVLDWLQASEPGGVEGAASSVPDVAGADSQRHRDVRDAPVAVQ